VLRIALAGPMAVGKSTTGRALAERLDLPFVDLDLEVGDIPRIFQEEGEAGFRKRELEALRQRVHGEGVLSLGGGCTASSEARTLLKNWNTYVLMARMDTLRLRMESQGRPLAAQWEKLYIERQESWRMTGPWIWVDGLEPSAVVQHILENLPK